MIGKKLCLIVFVLFAPKLFAAEPGSTPEITLDETVRKEQWIPPTIGGLAPGAIAGQPNFVGQPNSEILSPSEKRLEEAKVQLYEKADKESETRIDISAEKLGALDLKVLGKKDAAAKQALAEFFEKNSASVGNAKGYEYVIDNVTPQGFTFHQVVNGLEIPRSQIVMQEGEVVILHLTALDPKNPMLDKSTWMSQNELEARTIAIIDSELGGYDSKNVIGKPEYRIVQSGANADLHVIYETNYNMTVIWIDAFTGEFRSMGNAVKSVRECDRIPHAQSTGHRDCDAVTFNGFSIFTIYRNGNCIGGSSLCSRAELDAVKRGADEANWYIASIGQIV